MCSPSQYGGGGTTFDLFLYIEHLADYDLAWQSATEACALAQSVANTTALYERPPDGFIDWENPDACSHF